ncbi:MAG: glycosyltransferase [Blastocatellia bacterium]
MVRIIDRLNIGGPAKHVTWLTAGMEKAGFETTLVTGVVPPGEGDMGWFARAAGIEPVVIQEMSRELGPRDALVIWKLVRLLFRLRPQVIHTHKAKAGAAGRVAAMIYKWATPSLLWGRPRPVYVAHTFHGHTFHSYFGVWKTWLFVLIERFLARFGTDRVVVISQRQLEEIHDQFGVGRRAQLRVVPLGIDFGETAGGHGLLRRQYDIGADETLVGIVGRLCEVKNHAMLLEVAARLKAQGVRARFVIIGDGHLRDELTGLAIRLGVINNVTFTGFRDDATALYSDLDIIALTSLNEGTPLTLIEGMACGRPVIATAVGGVHDLMGLEVETGNGFTVWHHGVTAPSRDVAAYARALKFLIDNPELRQTMGECARDFTHSRMSRQRLVADMAHLYQEMLGAETGNEKPAPSGEALESLGKSWN